jgi:hypothetical protein
MTQEQSNILNNLRVIIRSDWCDIIEKSFKTTNIIQDLVSDYDTINGDESCGQLCQKLGPYIRRLQDSL